MSEAGQVSIENMADGSISSGGMVIRLNPNGSIPDDNPYVGDPNAEDEIWSYDHRNIESAAFDPNTGRLWIAEVRSSEA